ncbi:MAG: hypothetical protein GXN93_01810 [Candidatus Diapherotrites archaeon]|nr:hypothetical protein [Candidatus Diapherotrites archaeon]
MATTATTTEEIVHTLREISTRLRIIEEALGIAYDDEGIIDPDVVKALKKRAAEANFISEEEFWREVGVEDRI